jgi:serine/threonine protein kinase/formylglycine-generating enzyme required for sulfatase activity
MSEIPNQLGNYRILKKLGAGGMADVYEAVDERLQRHVALKVLPIEFARDTDRKARFDKEVKATANLRHPNIVTVYDVGFEQGYSFYTMELMPGGDLKGRLIDGIGQEEIIKVTLQIAEALASAHDQGFVHRDLKPENILFDSHNNAIVTDLGIAKFVGETMTQTGLSIGTPYYMSPEQIRGKRIDGRSDLYSLGALIYRMLTRENLFEAEDSVGICMQHVSEPPPPLPAHAKAFQPYLDRLLAKEPEDRYPNARAFIDDFKRIQLVAGNDKVPSPDPEKTQLYNHDSAAPDDSTVDRQFPKDLKRKKDLQRKTTTKTRLLIPVLALLGVVVVAVVGWAGFTLLPFESTNEPKQVVNNEPVVDDPVQPGNDDDDVDPTPENNVVVVSSGDAVLQLTSAPEGVNISLNGKVIGVTPVLLEGLPAGAQTFVLSKRFFADKEVTFNLTDNTVVKENVALQNGRGSLTLISTPEGAWIKLNGSPRSEITPTTLPGLPAGEYNLEIGKDDAYFQSNIAIDHDQTLSLRPALTAGALVKFNEIWMTPSELLQAANNFLSAGKVAGQGSDNALSAYRALLEQKPNSTEAAQGVEAVFLNLKTQIETALDSKNLNAADKFLADTRQWFPNRDEYAVLEQRLNTLKAELANQNREQQYASASAPVKTHLAANRFEAARRTLADLKNGFGEFTTENNALEDSIHTAEESFSNKVLRYSGKLALIPAGNLKNESQPVSVKPFRMGINEVTFAQWDLCHGDGACTYRPEDEGWGRGQRPVIHVSYRDISEQFIPWLNRKTGQQFRLPSEAEWEYAASANSNGTYYWGPNPSANHANGSESRGWIQDGFVNTAPVGQLRANAFGLYDTAGNVWELVEDCDGNKNAMPTDGKANSNGNCNRRIAKGGSWFSGAKFLQVQERLPVATVDRNYERGFRIVLDY